MAGTSGKFGQAARVSAVCEEVPGEQLLEEIDAVMLWAELLALIEPRYPKDETGRPPVGLGIMLRLYFVQHWFALSDPAAEDALYDSAALRRFVGIDLGRAPAPDETMILNFRHPLEQHDLCGQMLDTVSLYLASCGIRITTGRIVMRRSFTHPRRPRTRRNSATMKCTRRRRATSGISG